MATIIQTIIETKFQQPTAPRAAKEIATFNHAVQRADTVSKKLGFTLTGLGGNFGRLAAALRPFAVLLGGLGLIELSRRTIDVNARFEDLQIGLAAVFGSVRQGRAEFERLNQLATQTQFGVETLTKSAIQLQGAGIKPTNELLKQFTDTAASTVDQLRTFEALTRIVSRSTAGGLGLEELNQLADAGIPVFQILEKELGRTRLELSEFGKTATGSKAIVDALLKGLSVKFGGATEKSLDNLTVAMSNLSIAFDNFLAKLSKSSGATDLLKSAIRGLTDVLTFLTENIDIVQRAIAGMISVAVIRGIALLATNFQRVVVAVRALTIALLSNPLSAIPTIITLAVASLAVFSKEILGIKDKTVTTFDVISATFQVGFESIKTSLLNIGLAITKFLAVFKQTSFVELISGIFQQITDKIKEVIRTGFEEIRKELQNLPLSVKKVLGIEPRASVALPKFGNETGIEPKATVVASAEQVEQAFLEVLKSVGSGFEDFAERVRQRALAIGQGRQPTTTGEGGQTTTAGKASLAKPAVVVDLETEIDARKRQAEAAGQSLDALKKVNQELEAEKKVKDALQQGRVVEKETILDLIKTRDLEAEKLQTNVALQEKQQQRIQEFFANTYNKLEDTLVNFAKTGKFQFENLISFILEQVLRLAVIKPLLDSILGPLATGAGKSQASGGGNFISSIIGGFLRFASGGVARLAGGGVVGRDKVPALLETGEIVLSKGTVRNLASSISRFASGGLIDDFFSNNGLGLLNALSIRKSKGIGGIRDIITGSNNEVLSSTSTFFGDKTGSSLAEIFPPSTLASLEQIGTINSRLDEAPEGDAIGGLIRKKMASGGRALRDRIPALLEPGEFVVRRPAVKAAGVRNLERINAHGKAALPQPIVNINNNGTAQQTEAPPSVKIDGDKLIVDVVLRDIRNNGAIKRTLRGLG